VSTSKYGACELAATMKSVDSTEHLAAPGVNSILWRGSDGQEHSELASPALLHERFADCVPYRAGVQYQNRLNRHSRQFFAPQGSHVWCESAVEAEALLVLDFEGDVRRIAAQPMKITFADGTHHFPDFFALLRNRDQIVYDVKPSGCMNTDAAAQFAKTAAVCAQIGWRHQVLHEAHPVKLDNLSCLRAARHPRYHPPQYEFNRIRAVFADARSFRDGAVMVNLRHPYLAAAHIRHLLWHRYLNTDFDQTITEATVLRTTRKAEICNCGA
jgi:hypothetical protein